MAINRIFGAVSLTQGTGSLTNIDSLVLTDNDMAMARGDSNLTTGDHAAEYDGIYFYRWESSRSDVHNPPSIIKPTTLDVGLPGRWFMISPSYFMENLVVDPNAGVIVNEIFGNDAGLTLGYDKFGPVSTVSITNGGDSFSNGTYLAEPTSGGSGSGLVVDVVITSGSVFNVSIRNPGNDYAKGDVVTLNNFAGTSISIVSVNNFAMKILGTDIQVTYDTRFFGLPTFEVSSGSPFSVSGNQTQVDDLNAEFVGGEPVTNISLLDDNTNKYSVLPQVTDATTILPVDDADLVTLYYLNTAYGGPNVDHGAMSGLGDDDHTQYSLVDGTRSFSRAVSGVEGTANSNLTTRGSVISSISTHNTAAASHSNLMSIDGSSRKFTVQPPEIDAGIDPVTIYTGIGDTRWLATKGYVDNALSTSGIGDLDTTYLRLDAGNNATGRVYTSNITTLTPIGSSGATSSGEYITRTDLDNAVSIIMLNSDSYSRLDSAAVTFNNVKRSDPTASSAFTPTTDYHLVTKIWLESNFSGSTISHGDLTDLLVDDHTQYILANATREFSAVPYVNNILDPIAIVSTDWDLATKGYVDNYVATTPSGVSEVNGVSGAVNIYDDPIYAMSQKPVTNGTLFQELPYVDNNGVLSLLSPSDPWDLATKQYVDQSIGTTFDVTKYVSIYGNNTIVNNQTYRPVVYSDYFVVNQTTSLSRSDDGDELVRKGYIDDIAGLPLTSASDGIFGYLGDKVISKPSYSAGVTVIPPNVDASVTSTMTGVLDRFHVRHGGSGFIVSEISGSPSTFTGWGVDGTSGVVTETSFIVPTSETGIDSEWYVYSVYGDIEYIEIVSGGTGYLVDDLIYVNGDGDGATWVVTTIDGVGAITGVGRYDYGGPAEGSATRLYANVTDTTIVTIGGSAADIRPVIAGEIVAFDDIDVGDGYTSSLYEYKGAGVIGGPVNDGFVITGSGVLTNLDVDFINPNTEKVELSISMDDVSNGNTYTLRVNNGVLELVQTN